MKNERRTRAPMMVTAPPEEIEAWNRAVDQRKVTKRLRAHTRAGDRRLLKSFKGNGQHPKFPKERVRKQHKHPLRDEHGAYTLVGGQVERHGIGAQPTDREHVLHGVIAGEESGEQSNFTFRRIWLGGVSAQRGY
jgi:hypothetical protein